MGTRQTSLDLLWVFKRNDPAELAALDLNYVIDAFEDLGKRYESSYGYASMKRWIDEELAKR